MIYTFYSYKGGVGRSMALANVAVGLYRRGARVLVIDWDLEAPGLENFFFESESQIQGVKSQFGVIDMLLDYKRQYSLVASVPLSDKQEADTNKAGIAPFARPFDQVVRHLLPLRNFLCPVFPPQSLDDPKSRGLWLLPSGWRSTGRKSGESSTPKDDRFSKYAEAVQSFDWAEFYTHFDGESFFNWFREQLLPFPVDFSPPNDPSAQRLGLDAVLIDSRTGVTEMGGVCTRQLADVIVSFCAPNYQNLDGVARMSESFAREDLRKIRGGRLPEVVVVPARIDLQGETSEQNRFRSLFDDRLKVPLVFEQLGLKMWDLQIPYVTKYAYREALAVGVPDSNKTLEKAYTDLTTRLVLLSGDSGLQKYFEADLNQLRRAAGISVSDESISAAEELISRASSALENFSSHEQAIAKRVLTRLVSVGGGVNARLLVDLDEFDEPEQAVIARLIDLRLLILHTGVTKRVQLAHDALLSHWPKLEQWLQEDREFLLWRQRLQANVSAWKQRERDKGALLPKDLAIEAMQWLRVRPESLTQVERIFVEASYAFNVSRTPRLVSVIVPIALTGILVASVLTILVVDRSVHVIRSPLLQTFLWSFLGALVMQLAQYMRLANIDHDDSRHARYGVFYWVLALSLSLVGGLAGLSFQTADQPLPSFLAVYIGASMPLVIRDLSKGLVKRVTVK